MHDLLVMCDELRGDDVATYRSCGNPQVRSCGPPVIGNEAKKSHACEALEKVSGQGGTAVDLVASSDSLAALRWATGLKCDSVVISLATSLPSSVIQEHVELYHEKREEVVPKPIEPLKIYCNPSLLASRVKVCQMLFEQLRSCGCDPRGRWPTNFMRDALIARVHFSKRSFDCDSRNNRKNIKRWFNCWLRDGGAEKLEYTTGDANKPSRAIACQERVWQRKRRSGGGRRFECVWLREELYTWFVAMRYSIDWKALDAQRRSSGAPRKSMGRFPRRLLVAKCEQLLAQHCHQALVEGSKVQVIAPTCKWFRQWQAEYGLSMRRPNRKYKVPKYVLEERLKLWWITLFRIRALCLAIHGYDPEMENWDQSPFHNNESGSQDIRTLAVKGKEVPLVEGHHDTRERWTANFTTWSNKQRISEEGPPYCELCFKAQGEKLQGWLQEHVRSRGFGSWFTVITAPKGSYRETDVLNFLDKHLPKMTPGRQWRIIMADDYGPHKSQNAFRLCWSRGYVLVVHGGGTTPVAQTVDTDYNQHAKRHYTNLESAELIDQFRESAVAVPKIPPRHACDLMHLVASRKDIHAQAADGFKKTGATIDLDGSEDNLVVREAGIFWNSLHMRAVVDKEIKNVREEVEAGRLSWTFKAVQGLICQYPSHRAADKTLALRGDIQALSEDDSILGEDDPDDDSAVAEEEEEDNDDTLSITDVSENDAEERKWDEWPGPGPGPGRGRAQKVCGAGAGPGRLASLALVGGRCPRRPRRRRRSRLLLWRNRSPQLRIPRKRKPTK